MGRSSRGPDQPQPDVGVLLAWAAALLAVMVSLVPLVWHDADPGPANALDRWGRRAVGAGLTRLLRDVHVASVADRIFPRLADMGSAREVAAVAIVLGLIGLVKRDGTALALSVLGPLVAVAITEYAAKPLVGRVRDGAYQYPSGHCTGASAVGTVGVLLLWRYGGRPAVGRLGWLFIVPPVLVLVAVQRLRFHDLTESVAGLATGAGTVLAVEALRRHLSDRRRRAGRPADRVDDRQPRPRKPAPTVTVWTSRT